MKRDFYDLYLEKIEAGKFLGKKEKKQHGITSKEIFGFERRYMQAKECESTTKEYAERIKKILSGVSDEKLLKWTEENTGVVKKETKKILDRKSLEKSFIDSQLKIIQKKKRIKSGLAKRRR
jgi:hypothetical protein